MNNNLFSYICIFVILSVIIYSGYFLFSTNNMLNINELQFANNKNVSINNTESAPIEKEIVYEYVEIASYSSTLYDNSQNRVYNITKACEILNGTTINPGEEFSFNDTIGPMGEENGYKKATGFDSDGRLIQIPAGGMCQVSSTLYNVALLGNLEVTERHPHSRRVSYVPADRDATVYYGSLDLRFINNTDSELKIEAYNDDYTVTIKMYKKEQSN